MIGFLIVLLVLAYAAVWFVFSVLSLEIISWFEETMKEEEN